MEDLQLGIIAALVPEFAVKDLPLGKTLMMMMMLMMIHGSAYNILSKHVIFFSGVLVR